MLNDVTSDGLNEPNRKRSPTETTKPTITPHENDVVSGRGSGANRHVGNAKFRELVRDNKALYMKLTKHEKMSVARTILATISSRAPSGRFLQKNPETFQWFEIGPSRALEKISQALREKTHQPVQDKPYQCQTSHPQNFWPNGIYHRSTQDGGMMPLHLRNDRQYLASNGIESQLNNPSNSAEEIPRFSSRISLVKNQRNNSRPQYLHKLPQISSQNNSIHNYDDTLRYDYNHNSLGNKTGVHEPMIQLKMPPMVYNREQSFSMMFPPQVEDERISSKKYSAIDSSSMHSSLNRRQPWSHNNPLLQINNDIPRCPPFPPLPQPPLLPEFSDCVFPKHCTQALRGRKSWNNNSNSTAHTATMPSKSVSFVQNRASPPLKMHLPTVNSNPLNPQQRISSSSALFSRYSDLQIHGHARELQYTNNMKRTIRQINPYANESKRICLNVEEGRNHNVVSSESNDEETVSTQALSTDSNSSSNTNSPSSCSGETDREKSKNISNTFESSGLLALSAAASMRARNRDTSPS